MGERAWERESMGERAWERESLTERRPGRERASQRERVFNTGGEREKPHLVTMPLTVIREPTVDAFTSLNGTAFILCLGRMWTA